MIETPPIHRPDPGWLAGPPAVIRLAGTPTCCLVVSLSEAGLEHALAAGWAPIRALALGQVAPEVGTCASPVWRVTGPATPPLPSVVLDLATLDQLLGRADAGQPLFIRVCHSAVGLEQAFHVPADLSWFSGHFPGEPILPGIVQVKFAVDGARTLPGYRGPPCALQQLKFKMPIRPEQVVQLALRITDGGATVLFSFRSAAGEHSSGRLACGES
ncbi:MAG: hypothetical protein ABL989_04185 [Gammaproteobacteria bacterium]